MFDRADYNFIIKYGGLTPDGVAVYDLNSRKFVYLNRFFERIFGMPGDELLEDPKLIIDRVHPDDLGFLDNRYRELLSIGCIGPTEFRIMFSNGSIRFLSAEVLWVEDSYTFAIFVKDINPQRIHDEYVLSFTAQKDALLDMLIHNLSGPLYLSRDVLKHMGENNGKDGHDFEKTHAMVLQNTEQCLDIVNDFLKREHVESVNTFVIKTRFALPEKINLTLALMKQMNPGKKFTLNTPAHGLNISSDAVKFCQVVHNVLSNSVKYTRDDGHIDITVTEEEQAYRIDVRDDGTGIPEELKSRLFKERVDGKPGLKGEKSNGMGLYIVKQLMHMLGGDVKLGDAERGTTVVIEIPQE
jgi:two-component system, OmpR family, sensor histidine kinase VicK